MNHRATIFENGTVIGRSVEFRLERDEKRGREAGVGRIHFVHSNGSRVATDEAGARIWEALPGTIGEVRDRLGEVMDLSKRMLEDLLFIMVRAGIATAGGDLSGERSPEDSARIKDSGREVGFPQIGISEKCVSFHGNARPSVESPAVSVVIVTYNSALHIRACLTSLRVQTCAPLDIHVVDNGSTDATVEIVRRDFPEVVVHVLRRNRYYPGGINAGIAVARGAYILVLNDDVELESEAAAEMIRVMDGAPRAAAIAPMLKLFHLRGFLNGIGNHVRPRGWGSDNFVGSVDIGQFDGLVEVPSACVSAVLLRREAVKDVGLFDASFRAYYEDPDWCFRARLRGWVIAAAPKAVVFHKFSAHWSGKGVRFMYAARNRLRFIVKNFCGRIFWAFLRSYVKEDVKTALSQIRKGRIPAAAGYARAYGSLLLHLPGDLMKRTRIQRRRVLGVSVEDILALNPVPWTCLNDENNPKIDVPTYFEYYRWLLKK